MRVIAGEFRSRLLAAPRGLATRPTSDRLRETLFSVLGTRVQGCRFADLYAGSGAVGIEALSRGATHSLFVEQAGSTLKVLRDNLQALQLGDRALVDGRSVARALAAAVKESVTYNIVFLDPPYAAAGDYTATLTALGAQQRAFLAEDALVVAEHARRQSLAASYGALLRTRVLEQGDAALSFFSVRVDEPSPARSEA